MVLLGTPPASFLPNFRGSPFFFSGLTAGPTYRPPVRHSNADTPLGASKEGGFVDLAKFLAFKWLEIIAI